MTQTIRNRLSVAAWGMTAVCAVVLFMSAVAAATHYSAAHQAQLEHMLPITTSR